MTEKEYQDQLQKITDEFSLDMEEYNPTFAESELLFSLKAYVDKRFDLLKEGFDKNKI